MALPTAVKADPVGAVSACDAIVEHVVRRVEAPSSLRSFEVQQDGATESGYARHRVPGSKGARDPCSALRAKIGTTGRSGETPGASSQMQTLPGGDSRSGQGVFCLGLGNADSRPSNARMFRTTDHPPAEPVEWRHVLFR
jgi:hypothetical protein